MKNNCIIFVIQENIGFNSPIVTSIKANTDAQVLIYSELDEVEKALMHSTPSLLIVDIDYSNSISSKNVLNLIGFAIPSIVLSAKNDKGFAIDLLKNGAIDYILKGDAHLVKLIKSLRDVIDVITLQASLRIQKRRQRKNLQIIFAVGSSSIIIMAILFVIYFHFI